MNRLQKWAIRGFYLIWLGILAALVKPPFTFLILNTFLAYIPIELSFHVGKRKPQNGLLFWLISLVWLLFYPNAPYLLTDLFHLSLLEPYGTNGLLRLDNSMWLNFTLLIVSALPSTILGMWGLGQVNDGIIDRLHLPKWSTPIGIIILSILSSIGIFIGRFLRIHTIYLFMTPSLFIQPLLNMWSSRAIRFMILLTLVQLIIYWSLHLISSTNSTKKDEEN
ncbi:DUF1361 domain-containing protein [Lentilactobacillus senioris]|uniref:DUF1361 domain-containing protein n=1 Tax=Lentilactobacillus senioris TaxID=931534 RepID=UPI0022811027|nr:DUF1361 domain-containing protein [Lentilactobacillus senioris]MCY9807225.1 DUF1361 domain-containing protein [Lentilactobacillus senioris]